MFKHNIKIAIRNIIKYWNYSIINIGGLAIGLASFIFIVLYIDDEIKYDKYHEHADRVYRVNRLYNNNDVDEDAATLCFPAGPTLVLDYPGIVEKQVRFFNQLRNQWFFDYQKSEDEIIRFNEPHFMLADSTVFDVFTFPFIEGDPKTALDNPNTIVVTESTAKKYFGDESAMGKVLRVEEGINFEITGVIKDLPTQSHLKIDILGSLNTTRQFFGGQFPETWIWNPCWTYVLLHEGINPEMLDEKFPEFYENHYTDLRDADVTLYLQSLTDIHLKSHHVYEMRPNSNSVYVYILSIVALIILALACINFMNLATASSAGRAKEIGIKKVFGSQRRKLVIQFLGEAVVQSFVAMLIAIIIVELLIPGYNNFTGKVITPSFLVELKIIGFIVGVAFVVGLIAGVYPAFVLSSFKPLKVLKGALKGGAKSGTARKVLVIVQFSISISLIIGSLIVFAQLKFLRNAELGFKKDHIINIQRVGPLFNSYEAFRQQLLSHKDIDYVTGAEDYLGINHNTRDYEVEGLTPGQRFYIPTFMVDWDFVETFDIKVVEGRAFSRDFQSDTVSAIMINETMAKDLGWSNEEAIGKRITSRDGDERVIGVYKDFNAMSLHRPVNKFILDMFRRPGVFAQVISIRFSSNNYQEVIMHIENVWNEFVPTRPFEYQFFEEQLDELYKDELRFGRFSLMLTILAILIASMGLVGLTSFLAEQRTKEIGIRRALGSSINSIISLMAKEFLWLLLVANIISWPITYYFTTNWLESYSRHISTNWMIYILSGILTLVIAMSIITYRAYKTALLNPADTLRYE
ncbi:MAG: FtsX-like permease family protein [Bacteroidales bacterium]|nr:FtsX-like permease family protein [Bacteroidales bacterium]